MSVMLHSDPGAGDRVRREQVLAQSHWLEASDAYGSMSVAKNLIPLLALYAAIPYLADRSLALALSCAPLIGLLLYRLTMVMHDCGHATLFKTRIANDRAARHGRGTSHVARAAAVCVGCNLRAIPEPTARYRGARRR